MIAVHLYVLCNWYILAHIYEHTIYTTTANNHTNHTLNKFSEMGVCLHLDWLLAVGNE